MAVSASVATLAGCAPDAAALDDDQLASRASSVGVEDRAQLHSQVRLFDGGTAGYHSYRIPSLITAPNGTLIAFVEGRMSQNDDYGNINVLYKTSSDDGKTWSALKQVVGAGQGTWGNPTAVVDRLQNRIWLFMSWNDADHAQGGHGGLLPITEWGQRRVFVSHSDNNGGTWTKPEDLTATLLPPSYAWDAIGPGVGIQTQDGRLIVPASSRNIYAESDTVGNTVWKYAMTPRDTSEGTIVEMVDGSFLRNDRGVGRVLDVGGDNLRRWVSRGTIEGGFAAFKPEPALLDTGCEGSTLRYTSGRILFLNPATTSEEFPRCRMKLRVSYDDGRTWPIDRYVYDSISLTEACKTGKGGYSSIAKTADNQIGMLIEVDEAVGTKGSHRSIDFHKVNLPWLLHGTPEPQ